MIVTTGHNWRRFSLALLIELTSLDNESNTFNVLSNWANKQNAVALYIYKVFQKCEDSGLEAFVP